MTVETAPRRPKTFRLPVDLVAALETASVVREVPQTLIVEDALRRALCAAEEGPAAGSLGGAHPNGREGSEPSPAGAAPAGDQPAVTSPASPQLRDGDTVGLSAWLSERTGEPFALCRMFLAKGRVRVGGKVCRDAVVARGSLSDVTLDGEAV